MRRLVIETDGALLNVLTCEWRPLEVVAGLQRLLYELERGNFPYPNGVVPKLCIQEAVTDAERAASVGTQVYDTAAPTSC